MARPLPRGGRATVVRVAGSSWERYLNGKKPVPRGAVEALCRVAGERPERLMALWELADAEWSGRARTAATMLEPTVAATAPGPEPTGGRTAATAPGPARARARALPGRRGVFLATAAVVLMAAGTAGMLTVPAARRRSSPCGARRWRRIRPVARDGRARARIPPSWAAAAGPW